jgi:hypothetical protein|tara:strand:- start:269 stop:466 length:198 start_codon:yes stop_codon:yes gene_type:complete
MTSPSSAASGMSKREHFAALALQGVLAQGVLAKKHAAQRAVDLADALIKALNEESLRRGGGPPRP